MTRVAGGQGRSQIGKIVVVGAVEVDGPRPGRIRLEVVPDYRAQTLQGFIQRTIAPGSNLVTDGNRSYASTPGYTHSATVVRSMPAHLFLPWVHRVFANVKRWGTGVLHGFRKKYLAAYLNEFVFRWNRRYFYRSAFDSLLGIAVKVTPATLSDIRASAA